MFGSQRLRSVAGIARRGLGIAALAVVASTGALGVAVCIEACGSDETGGQRVVLDTHVEPVADAASFTTALGWNVTLTRALIATGPLYYFDGAPPLVRLLRRRLPAVRD